MFRSYRPIVFALVGWLSLASWQANGQGYQGSDGNPKNQTTKPAAPMAAEQQAERAPRYRNPCQYSDTHDDSDLCAQWRAANAAQGVFEWTTGRQYTISIIEALGLGLSLIFSAIAAVMAIRASRTAEKQLLAADRPHLLMSELVMNITLPEPTYTYRFQNFGNGPGWLMSYGCIVRISDLGDDISAHPEIEFETCQWPVTPGGWWGSNEPTKINMPAEQLDRVRKGDAQLHMYWAITYHGTNDVMHMARTVQLLLPAENRFVPVASAFWAYT